MIVSEPSDGGFEGQPPRGTPQMERPLWTVVSVGEVLPQIERVEQACPFVSFEGVVVVVRSSSFELGPRYCYRLASSVVVFVAMTSLDSVGVVVSSSFVWGPKGKNRWSFL